MESRHIKHIAIADDHAIIREGLTALINLFEGFNVSIEAGNGKELINKIAQTQQFPDVCILDINMPVMNGLETITVLKQKWSDLPVLVLTVGDNDVFVKKMLAEGANGYLLKSCTAQELRNAIECVSQNKIYFSELVSKQLYYAIRKGEIRFHNLSAMEIKVLEYSCLYTDLTYEEIGKKMGITKKSVEGHRDNLFRKLAISNRAGLVKYAVQNGLILLDNLFYDCRSFYEKR